MFCLMKVFGGVPVPGRIATTDVTADQAFPQMDPGVAHLQTFLAALAAWLYFPNFFQVRTN
jgi:hypothetical protein